MIGLRSCNSRFSLARILALFLALSGVMNSAAFAAESFVPPMPSDPDKVEISLLTVGRGPQVYALYGHTIIRVIDPLSNLDVGFNWGMFDFAGPAFMWRFYAGDLRYQLAVIDTPTLLDQYRLVERRRVVEEPLNLSKNQKMALMRRLIWNAQPENLAYQYNQFFDNCSTKPRDHIDAVLGGKIKEHYGDRPTPESFRQWIRFGAKPVWWAYLGLDILTNGRLDLPVTAWQQMFLPENLRRYLRDMPAYSDDGHSIPGQSLLGETTVLVDYDEPSPSMDPYFVVALMLAAPMIGVGMTVRHGLRESTIARTIGAMALVFGTWSAIWGTLLLANWVLSGYTELKHSASLWVFWPVDWYFVAYGVKALRAGRRPPRKSFGIYLSLAHLAGLLILFLLWLAGFVRQDVLPLLASMGTMSMVFCWVFFRLGMRGEYRNA